MGTPSWETLYSERQNVEPIDSISPEEVAEEADLMEHVRRAISELPPGQRSAVKLFYLNGLTRAETAAVLGIEGSAVKTRLHKARATLRRHLSPVWKVQEMTLDEAGQFVEVRIIDVRRNHAEDDKPSSHVVVLEQVDGTRRLPIWIGPYEAEALVRSLEQIDVPRPLTYGFMADLLRAGGLRLHEVRISQLVELTFHAVAVIDGPTGTKTVDARPSDALNLALVLKARIVVEAALFEDQQAARPVVAQLQGFREAEDALSSETSEGRAAIAADLRAKYSREREKLQATRPL